MAITMEELANKARVSRSTVDRVLHGRGRVSKETEERIRSLAKVYNYTPDMAGKTLAIRRKGYKVGIILNSPDVNPYYADVRQGILQESKKLEAYNITVILKASSSEVDPIIQADQIRLMVKEGVSVLIITAINVTIVIQALREAQQQGVKIIALSASVTDIDYFAYIGCDHDQAGRIAANLAYLMFPQNNIHGVVVIGSQKMLGHISRYKAFSSRLQQYYPEKPQITLQENNDDDFISYDRMKQLLVMHPETNLVFFATAGVNGGIRAILDSGRKDIKIIAFDLTDQTVKYLEKNIIQAVIFQNPQHQGRQAVRIAMDWIIKNQTPQRKDFFVNLSILLQNSLTPEIISSLKGDSV